MSARLTVEERRALALELECPACGAEPGHSCTRRRGRGHHRERLRLWRSYTPAEARRLLANPAPRPRREQTPPDREREGGAGEQTTPDREREADLEAWLAECVGHTEEEIRTAVEAGGGRFRVTFRDGHPLICTRDYRLDRVNVELVDGRVLRAYLG